MFAPKKGEDLRKDLKNKISELTEKIKNTSIKDIKENLQKSLDKIEKDLEDLLKDYLSLKEVNLKNIIDFHVRFERIHPLSDGNGRIGRIIMFKECLKNNIIPFIILDSEKAYYMRGLKEYNKDRKYLIDTILHFQDIYEDLSNQLLDYKI